MMNGTHRQMSVFLLPNICIGKPASSAPVMAHKGGTEAVKGNEREENKLI